MQKGKVDLTYLKRIVAELEISIGKADEILSKTVNEDRIDGVVELNKAIGLAAGILTEAGLLMGDIQYLIANATGGGTDVSKQDLVKQLLGGLKGPGTSN